MTRLSSIDLDAAVSHLVEADERMARVIRAAGPCRLALRQTSSVFGALAESIVHQQLSGKAAATIFGRLTALAPEEAQDLTATELMRLPDEALRTAGLSRNKQLALRDLATRSIQGEIPSLERLRRMEDEEIIEVLTEVRGIGRWTVEMFLIFRLGRPDVMAVDDLGLRRGHAVLMGRPDETDRKTLLAYSERWRPYRSVASWYLWRAVELAREGVGDFA